MPTQKTEQTLREYLENRVGGHYENRDKGRPYILDHFDIWAFPGRLGNPRGILLEEIGKYYSTRGFKKTIAGDFDLNLEGEGKILGISIRMTNGGMGAIIAVNDALHSDIPLRGHLTRGKTA